jgi:hypothetical protein
MQKARVLETEEAGKILVITAPIYNDSTCFSAACHVHSADQKTLGILDIGLHLGPLESSLSVLRGRMAGFTLMVLFLTIGGVTALLKRNVLSPIRNLAVFTEKAHHGNLPEKSPSDPMADGEIGIIANNFRRLHEKLVDAENRLMADGKWPPPADEDKNQNLKRSAADAGRDSRDTAPS